MVAVLSKHFGFSNIQLAEDIVSDTFLKATETWGLSKIPENPAAWLYQVAKNRAVDYLRRQRLLNEKIAPELLQNKETEELPEFDFSTKNLDDSLLEMIFAVCHPQLPKESQIVLSLRVLCGFGIDEIANALLSNKANINKRLFRAKEKIRKNNLELLEVTQDQISERLDSVLSVLYLLFNEGYYSTVANEKIRKDLCFEAMRLLHLLTTNQGTDLPKVNALMALFCFHASRFEARTNKEGEQILFDEQDTNKWNLELIDKGEYYIQRSTIGRKRSVYHFQAAIAFWHTRTEIDSNQKWENILNLYNRLLQAQYSPIAALNRTYALSKVKGRELALKEALKIEMNDYHLYHSLLAELYKGLDESKEVLHLKRALDLAPNKRDKSLILRKLAGR